MGRIRCLWLLAGAIAATPMSCRRADSLLQVDVSADAPFAPSSTLFVTVEGGPSKSFAGVTLEQVFHAGIYLPGSVSGDVQVFASIHDDVCGQGVGAPVTVSGVAAGKVLPPVALLIVHTSTCGPIPDGGAGGAELTGAGGESGAGTGGVAATGGVGLGGQTSHGGTVGGAGGSIGAGGALSTGGVTPTGGMIGAGGMVASGGITATGGITGTGGVTATGGVTGTGGCGLLLDDMELNTGFICEGSGRVGYWYTYVDPRVGSTISPSVELDPTPPALVSPARDTSTHAMHISGSFSQYAGMGFLLNAPVIDQPWSTFNASNYTGIRFWAKGNANVRVLIHIPATVQAQFRGTCTGATCLGALSTPRALSNLNWTQITVSFASLTSGTASFDSTMLSAIEFQPYDSGSFDLWVDDIQLY